MVGAGGRGVAGNIARVLVATLLPPGVALLAACGLSSTGAVASWELADSGVVTPGSTQLELGVTRLGCSGGVTGRVLAPVVDYQHDRIVIRTTVEPMDANKAYTCPSNDVVRVVLSLTEPVGRRPLVDGSCLKGGSGANTAACLEPDGVRWRPSP